METSVTRNFRVRGHINCKFEPVSTAYDNNVSNIKVQLWHKSPIEVVFLGEGLTDATGEFIIDFEMGSPTVRIIDGKINDVFLKGYYNDVLLFGDNPY